MYGMDIVYWIIRCHKSQRPRRMKQIWRGWVKHSLMIPGVQLRRKTISEIGRISMRLKEDERYRPLCNLWKSMALPNLSILNATGFLDEFQCFHFSYTCAPPLYGPARSTMQVSSSRILFILLAQSPICSAWMRKLISRNI